MTEQFNPDYVIHPGEYLEEILEARNMKKSDFAERCGMSVKAISQIINGKALYSSDAALQFERVLGIDAELLMNLVTSYQIFESRSRDREELEKREDWVKKFPRKEMVKYKIIPEDADSFVIAEKLLDFFNVSDPDTWDEYYERKAVSFRKSPKFKSSIESTATWLRMGEKYAETIESEPYDRETFIESLNEIRTLTVKQMNELGKEMVELCRKSGVALVFIPEIEGTHISGVTEWLSPDKALIIMSLRYKTNDHFWFTFFHEAGHILMHSKKSVFIDCKESAYSDREEEANSFACNQLIPSGAYKTFVSLGDFCKTSIQQFAKEIGIAPGVVVGRLQHEELIKYSWHNGLKKKMELKPGPAGISVTSERL